MRPLVAAAFALALALSGADAHAFSDAPGHADVKVKPKYKTQKGEKTLVGCTVTFCVRNPSRGHYLYKQATFGRPSLWTPTGARNLGENDRDRTHDPARFTGVLMGDDVPTPEQDVVVQGKIEIDFAKHGVKPGDRLTLVTGWNYGSGVHVFGAVTHNSADNEFTVPEK